MNPQNTKHNEKKRKQKKVYEYMSGGSKSVRAILEIHEGVFNSRRTETAHATPYTYRSWYIFDSTRLLDFSVIARTYNPPAFPIALSCSRFA